VRVPWLPVKVRVWIPVFTSSVVADGVSGQSPIATESPPLPSTIRTAPILRQDLERQRRVGLHVE